MEGTSHPAHRHRWLQKTGREQYAFKKANIEECQSHLYVPNLLPAGGAMSILNINIWVFRLAPLSNIWSLVQIEHSMFELV